MACQELTEAHRANAELQAALTKANAEIETLRAQAIDKDALRAELERLAVNSVFLKLDIRALIARFCPAPKPKTVRRLMFKYRCEVCPPFIKNSEGRYIFQGYACDRVENGDFVEFLADVPAEGEL